ncbi:DNA polymerase beta-like isoform X5 [Aythya fuligula]|uniref:DNA polymerase beta-like isoform X5 n=1 Tax=Aythya fuligula TaxID=219594 RepID=A0A6J3EM71_AYTFU|nr:DNA polymerase beta-like isoform X5 [Aythya fuligula]
MSKGKAPSGRPNPGISDLLTGGGALGGPRRASAAPSAFLPAELASYERNGNRAIHKYNAHRKAASVSARYPSEIRSGAEAKELDGVGAKIAEKIDEFLSAGKLRRLEKDACKSCSTAPRPKHVEKGRRRA